jgi:hypothetical protein
MARYLYIWELGAGLGHLSPLSPIVQRLIEAGHEVHAAIRSFEKVHFAFGDWPVTYWQAPVQAGGMSAMFQPPASLAHILANTCFRDSEEFATRMRAWDSLFRSIQPDLVILDHAPSALLSLEAYSIPRVLIGTGFTVPQICRPFPNWRPELDLAPEQLSRDEQALLDRLNRWRNSRRLDGAESLADLYAKAEHKLLTTFPELDHFGPRAEVYQGIWTGLEGQAFQWPSDEHSIKRMFVYLKPHSQLPSLLKIIRETQAQAMLYLPGVKSEIIREFRSSRMRFSEAPLNVQQAARECDLAILNATHGSVATFLLAGKPMLLLPMYLEQRITAERVAAVGAGSALPADHMDQSGPLLKQLLESDLPRLSAERFRDRYREFQFAQRSTQVADALLRYVQ